MAPLIISLAILAAFQTPEAAPGPSGEAEVYGRFATVCAETGGDWTKVEAAALALGFTEQKAGKAPIKRTRVEWKLDEADASWSASLTRLDANSLGLVSNLPTDLCSLGRTDKASGISITYTRALSSKP